MKCTAGYYCKGTGGSSNSAKICPKGYICPEGSSDYVKYDTATPPVVTPLVLPGFYSTDG